MNATDSIHITDAPVITGLAFRHFRGAEDYPKMMASSLPVQKQTKLNALTQSRTSPIPTRIWLTAIHIKI